MANEEVRKCTCGSTYFELGTWGGEPCLYCQLCSLPYEPTNEEIKNMTMKLPVEVKVERKRKRDVSRSTIKTVKRLTTLNNLLKKTVVAFADSYQGARKGHNSWCLAVKLYQKCEDEMDLDDNN